MEYNFLRMQQRKPVAQTKIKNLITGKVTTQNFHQSDSLEEAELKREKVKYLYSHRGQFVFCHENDSSRRIELAEETVGETAKYLKPNTVVEAISFDQKLINIGLPIKMEFKVIEAPPNIKGDTASGGAKAVTIETGAKINAPFFIKTGDIIRINTQTGEYAERAEKGN